ncbi:hypothetical protein GF378_03235 [Candidatus Pacearchaeota archaeon]|nr:hypothetical protein [Candidatus Pacearchaeota archaeon]
MKRKEIQKIFNKKDKKGVSPVIATVLLIGMVVVLALIVFVWMRALARETITKFDGENIELSCDKVSIDADYSSGILTVTNNGNTPIYRLKMRVEEVGRETTRVITEDYQWPKFGIDAGMSYTSEQYSLDISGSEEVVLIPVLLGNTEDGKKKTFTCDEKYGYKVI